jgi:large subunit ribosomal protein L21
MYAVLETGSKQYRVSAGDMLEIERLEVEAGKPVTFDRVLLVNNEGKVAVGTPTVTGASVEADVVEHKRGPKLIAFKMRRRKGYHRKVGHRQELTVVKIKEIKVGGETVAASVTAEAPLQHQASVGGEPAPSSAPAAEAQLAGA